MQFLNENISHDDLKKYIKEFYNYAANRLSLDHPPRLFLKNDISNSEDILGKTGGYDPEREEIRLYITNRHPKDVLRSFSHELVHHAQKLKGFDEKLDLSKTGSDEAYSLHDEGLREMERDAFERGNMIFRDWTDTKKLERKNIMTEMTKPQIKAAHKKAKKMTPSMKKQYGKRGEEVAYATATKQQLKKEGEEIKLDKEKADLNKDGKLSSYEKKRGKAIQMSIKKQAAQHAKTHMAARHGKDMDEQGLAASTSGNGEAVEKLQENKEQETQHPYPQLFEEKPRLMQDAFNKKEDIIYQELIRRFIKK